MNLSFYGLVDSQQTPPRGRCRGTTAEVQSGLFVTNLGPMRFSIAKCSLFFVDYLVLIVIPCVGLPRRAV